MGHWLRNFSPIRIAQDRQLPHARRKKQHMTVERLLADRPNLHAWAATGEPTSWAVNADVLRYMEKRLKPGMQTIETGAGYTTVLFGMKGCQHTCVTPASNEADAIQAYLAKVGATPTIDWVLQPSDRALPQLTSLADIQFAFIDGAHRFPLPQIDFHYIEPAIVVGGLLGVDDCNMPSVKVLCDFLDGEEEWRRTDTIGGTAFYVRTKETVIVSDWKGQKMNAQLAKRGIFDRIISKTKRTLS
jgi:hypothetical protein